jgi:HAE1 family hydrophobic/amphiphilic exporter-1
VGVEVALSRAVREIEQLVEPVRSKLPLGYAIELGGQADAFSRTMNAFIPSLLLALLITYLLLASLFESFTLPAVILTSVPFAATGGIIALRILHKIDYTVKLDVITMLGFVILIGVVVNNAILLVHQSLNRLAEGASPIEAILNGVSTRVRPIFMTMTTTVFGMSPLVFAEGSGSELYRGLGAILIGGLILSTLFTLILIPTLLSFVLRARETVDEHFVVSATPSR